MPEKACNTRFKGEPEYLVQAKQKAADALKAKALSNSTTQSNSNPANALVGVDRQALAAQTSSILPSNRGKPVYSMTCRVQL